MIHSLTGIMKELAALLVLLFVVSIHPDFCDGLECKKGWTLHGLNNHTEEKIDKNSTCPATAKYCYAGTCTKAGVYPFSRILWHCAAVYNMNVCPRIAQEQAARRGLKATIFDCNCEYGAEGENFSNAKFEILPVPISNVLTCKKGYMNSEEYGSIRKKKCLHDEDQYCYMASCAKGNEYVRTVWDCSPDTNCTAISAKVGKTVNSMVNCECRFGKANASLANENFTFPILPTTTPDKPTTTTDKPTTTTGKPTTITDKPTTTTDKPTTTTGKPTTKADKATPTADKSTNTTAEANLGVRTKISVGSGVLMAIGHVLASVLPTLGVGQLFNGL